jgi:hypothetical protein
MEVWKKLFADYDISNTGQIYNTKTDHILNPRLDKDGYYRVGLDYQPSKDGIRYRKLHRINQLVAKIFLENPNNYPQVHHINNIRTDNNVNNLQWVTSSKNNSLKPKKRGEFTSKYVGIVAIKQKKGIVWRALLFQNGKYILDKTCKTEEEAVNLRNKTIRELQLEEYFSIQLYA